jgi:hypothetical protein
MSDLTAAENALLDWVNGKNITGFQLFTIIQEGYMELTPKALAKLKELQGAVHPLEQEVKIQ